MVNKQSKGVVRTNFLILIDTTYEVVSHSCVIIITDDKSHIVLDTDVFSKDLFSMNS